MNYLQIVHSFREQVRKWCVVYPGLAQDLAALYTPPIVNPIVFNNDLLKIKPADIKYILVGDNPGISEMSLGRYLVGKAGQAARNAMAPLVQNFDSQVMVLNKTPIFTKSTQHLVMLQGKYNDLIIETQQYMANLVFEMHQEIKCPVYVIGFSGCRTADGIWLRQTKEQYSKQQTLPYFFSELRKLYTGHELLHSLYFYKHFSYGNFSKDLKKLGEQPLEQKLEIVGRGYRGELFKEVRA